MDHSQIEEIVAVMRASNLTEVEVRRGERVLRLRRPLKRAGGGRRGADASAVGRTAADGRAESAGVRGTDGLAAGAPPPAVAVTAGLVGIFHAAREPVVEGTLVAERQVLGQIESLRLMNDCIAPAAGRVRRIAVEEGQPVMYGQILFEIEPEGAGS